MVTAARKPTSFESPRIPSVGGHDLHAEMLLPRPPRVPQRLVVITPLVGATATQALLLFRTLTWRGSRSCRSLIVDTPNLPGNLNWIRLWSIPARSAVGNWYAREHGRPLHGCATCYGTVPLLAQFVAGGQAPPLKSISTVSGLLRLDQILRFETFASILGRRIGRSDDRTRFLHEIEQRAFDVNGDIFRLALMEYLQSLFPELRIGRDYFEELQYDRANILATLLQLSRARFSKFVTIPADIPCRFFYGRQDHLLGLEHVAGRIAYRQRVRQLVPHAELWEMEIDHYGRGPDHGVVLDALAELFEATV